MKYRRPRSSLVLVLSLLTCLLLAGGLNAEAAPPTPGPSGLQVTSLPPEARWIPPLTGVAAASGNPKMDSLLSGLASATASSASAAAQAAQPGGLRIEGNRVQVKITALAAAAPRVVAVVRQAGGEVTRIGNGATWLQAWIPVGALENVAANADVQYVSRPDRVLLDATTEGLAVMNGPAWQAAGYQGSGVKVAIVDGGFQDYTALLGTDLPAAVTIKNFVDGETDAQVDGTTAHGTSCAEIVHDIAPEATLYLVKVNTALDLQDAVTWLKGQSIDIISTSLGWQGVTPGDGTGFFANLVQSARDAGILWITAAGNERERHWGGAINLDRNGTQVFNIATGQNIDFFGPGDGNAYMLPPGMSIQVYLRWDDWASVNQDYDLYLLQWNGTRWSPFASSTNRQSGSPGQRPTETIFATTSGPDTPYAVAIVRVNATRGGTFELFVPAAPNLDQQVHQRSLANLADAPAAVTVAALNVVSPFVQESYSSEGPTDGPGGTATGGFVKPDVSGYANVTTASWTSGPFNGTSAATPHAAGAAALLMGAYPELDPGTIRGFLQGLSTDMGATGKDTVFGSGRLFLGALPSSITPKIYLPTLNKPGS